MKRRALLRAAAGSAVIGSSTLSGCLGVAGEDDGACDASDDGYGWCYGVGGRLDAVTDGTVFAREQSAEEKPWYERRLQSEPVADGEVVALDAATGEVQWTYGETGELDSYTELAVEDGVYFGHCGDDDCTELIAVDGDGEERWTRDVRIGYRRPIVGDGTVYVDGRPLRALDAATGEMQWTYPKDPDGSAAALHVDDVVYVESNAAIVALDPDDGAVRWQYDLGEQTVDTSFEDGIAYVVTAEQVAAVADGDRVWRWEFDAEVDRETEVVGIASDHLLVLSTDGSREHRLHAFDLETGDRSWVSDPIENPNPEYDPDVAVHDQRAYVGAAQLRALDAAMGSEHWNVALDAGPVQSVTVGEAGVGGDHEVFVQVDEHLLTSFTQDGERTWDESVPGRIWNYLADESVFVATDEGIFALERSSNS